MFLCGIIKPHALKQSAVIFGVLEAASVIILKKKSIYFTHELVEILYDHMSPEARNDIARRLVDHEALSLLLSAPSIGRLLEIVGKESDPRLCSPGSIRARFGIHAEPATVGNEVWFENAFHRPINAREAARDLMCIFNIQPEP
jgi:hypothetical protein